MCEAIPALISRRSQLKARFSTYIKSETREVVKIEIRKRKIEEIWYEFERAIEDSEEEARNTNEHYP